LIDDIALLKVLAAVYCEITGESLESSSDSQKPPGRDLTSEFETQYSSKMAPRVSKSKLAFIVIESIDYYLYDTLPGFEKMTAVARGVGSLLNKLARLYNTPTIVTATASLPKDYSKYTLSPWLNFTADSIFISKCYLRAPDDSLFKRPVTMPFVQSKKAPMYMDKHEQSIKEYKLRFKAKVLSLEKVKDTVASDEFFTERTFLNT
jgi:hypothetical protein